MNTTTDYHARTTAAIHHGQEVSGGAHCTELKKAIHDIKQSVVNQILADHAGVADKFISHIIDSIWKAEVTEHDNH